MNENQKTVKKSFSLTKEIDNLVEELCQSGKFTSRSEVARAAIWSLHSKLMQEGGELTVQKVSSGRPAKTQKEKREEKKMKKKEICDQLDGEVKNGKCFFYTYSIRDRYQQEIPLGHLTKTHIENQYDPSKEKVKELQDSGKINYIIEEEDDE